MMKKTYNINISGYAFTIDEDAYDILDSYLKTLTEICERTGQRETASDIEQRIAEIFLEEHSAMTGDFEFVSIITRGDVERVIRRIGAPEVIVGLGTESAAASGSPAPTPPPFIVSPVRKRLYRDIDNKMLGGVCSGLAWYLGADVVWVRLIMVALAFLTGSVVVLIYIVLWIVVPPAKSPYERMQMMGVDPSVSNVGKVVTGEYGAAAPGAAASRTPSMPGASSAAYAGRVVVMVLSVIGLLVSGALLLALSLAFIGCTVAICVVHGGPGESMAETRLILGCVIGGSLVAGLPLFLLFRWLLSVLTEKTYPPFTTQQRLFMTVPWLLGVAACITCGILLG